MGIMSGIGGLVGGDEEAKGFKQAEKRYGELRDAAPEFRERTDPFSEYRQQLADRLFRVSTGQESFETDPGYQFRMDQAMQETGRAAASRGMNRSGNVMAALQQRSQNIASQEYGNIINRLMMLSGSTPQASIAGAQAQNNAFTTGTTGMAAARIGRGQAQAGGISSLFGGIDSMMSGGVDTGTASQVMTLSDERLKDNVQKVAEIDGINLYTWEWNEEAKKHFGQSGTSFGVIAQEIEEARPDSVRVDPDTGYLVVDYREVF